MPEARFAPVAFINRIEVKDILFCLIRKQLLS
jgi:hypothetical protein